jgi:hypothetical protein
MAIRLLPVPFALFLGLGVAHAQNHSVFISGNVMTGQTWHAANTAGDGTSGSCSTLANLVQYYQAPFFTDLSADTYSLSLYYESFQSGFVYLYQDAFDPENPCTGIVAFGYAPLANIYDIHLDANRQYVFVTSEDVLYGGGGSFQVQINGPAGSHMFLGTVPSAQAPFCFGDGHDSQVTTACPCGNTGAPGHGCNNSIGTGGSVLTATGTLSPDTIALRASGELSSAPSIFLQSDTNVAAGITFGEGIRCVAGAIKRLALKTASAGAVTFPEAGDPAIHDVSARLGDPIPSGSSRYYQVYYRDPNPTFCAGSHGGDWNISNGIRITWP